MKNIWAIFKKEIKSYFTSPIAYVVIFVFLILVGFFFHSLISWFNSQSMQMAQNPYYMQQININQMVYSPPLPQHQHHSPSCYPAVNHAAPRRREKNQDRRTPLHVPSFRPSDPPGQVFGRSLCFVRHARFDRSVLALHLRLWQSRTPGDSMRLPGFVFDGRGVYGRRPVFLIRYGKPDRRRRADIRLSSSFLDSQLGSLFGGRFLEGHVKLPVFLSAL